MPQVDDLLMNEDRSDLSWARTDLEQCLHDLAKWDCLQSVVCLRELKVAEVFCIVGIVIILTIWVGYGSQPVAAGCVLGPLGILPGIFVINQYKASG